MSDRDQQQHRGLDTVSITSSSGSRPSPPALIAITKQGNRPSAQASPLSKSDDLGTSGTPDIDPTSFLMPVMDSGKSDQEYDDDINVKMEDDDDDDDDGMDDRYSIGYFPHAASLLVRNIFNIADS